MAQYIDKDALIAEIEKLVDKREYHEGNVLFYDCGYHDGINDTLDALKEKINTLEVKEVDFEKEAELIANGIMISVQANKYGTNIYNTERNDFNHHHLQMAARKGIELGLKVQKGE